MPSAEPSEPATATVPVGDWLAVTSQGPVDATVRLPGSKSLTNRYLVLAALADGPSRLRQPLRSRDTLLMAEALRRLGADLGDRPVTDGVDADWVIVPKWFSTHRRTPAADASGASVASAATSRLQWAA